MKKLLSVFMICMTALTITAQTKTTPKVEVIYFHGQQRCATCMAIERSTRELLEHDFSKQMKDGTVTFRTVDISTAAGEQTARKYHITWSALFVNSWKKDREIRNDMTRFAFKNARNNTKEFKQGIKNKVKELIK